MLLQLREDDRGGGPYLKGLFETHHLEGLLRAEDQGLGCPGLGHNDNTCNSPVSTVLSGLI